MIDDEIRENLKALRTRIEFLGEVVAAHNEQITILQEMLNVKNIEENKNNDD